MPISLSSSSVVKPSPTLSDAAAFASANPQSADPASASTTGAANTLAAAMNKETGLGDRMLHQEFFEGIVAQAAIEFF